MTYAKLQYAKALHKEKENIVKQLRKASSSRKVTLRKTNDEVTQELVLLHSEIHEWLESPEFDDQYYMLTKEFIEKYYIRDSLKPNTLTSNLLREVRRMFGE